MDSPLGNRVFMTGGAGFLGRAILDRATREEWDAQFTIYSRDEEKQWRVRNRWPNVNTILGDINDAIRLTIAVQGHDTVLHLAAHKFVPEAERDVSVAVTANITGSKTIVDVCTMARPKVAILISTDKASDPVSLYGMTKAVAEKLWGEAHRNVPRTKFHVARYGNVIGSTGSVLPHFVAMAQRGEKLTLTDPKMTRFLMPVNEAIDAIIAAYNTDHFMTIPSPKAADLYTIAKAAVIASGKFTNLLGELDYTIIGHRPGEKMHETLISARESRFISSFKAPFYYMQPEAEKPPIKESTRDTVVASNTHAITLTATEIASYYNEVRDL